MANTLVVSENGLNQHFGSLGAILDQAASVDANTEVVADWAVVPLSAGLVGKGCEIASRNRGTDSFVAPLFCIGAGIWAWLGLYQEWASERGRSRTRRFSYRSTTLTVHLGFRNIRHKPQIFRAEWAGWARWNGQTYGAQAGNAGHPHWQFDAVESLRKQGIRQLVSTYMAVLSHEADTVEPRTFSPNSVQTSDMDEIVAARDFSRIHFASVAPWWRSTPDDGHAHFPSSAADVESWVQKTIDYTVEELGRLQ